MNGPITVAGELPNGGQDFAAIIDADVIALRIKDRICITHHNWMTLAQARDAAAALERLMNGDPAGPDSGVANGGRRHHSGSNLRPGGDPSLSRPGRS